MSDATVSQGILTQAEKDNLRRGIRTGIQSVGGFAAAGGFNEIWQHWLSSGNHSLSPFLVFLVGIVLTGVASWAQNVFEDKTGKSLFSPTDRKIGGQVLQKGLGAKSPTAQLSVQPDVKKAT